MAELCVPENVLFVCQCEDPSHQMVWQLYDFGSEGKATNPPESNVELHVSVHLNSHLGFFKRLIAGTRYVLGYKSKFGGFEALSFKHDDIDRLAQVLIEFKKKVSAYTQKAILEAVAPLEQVKLDHIAAQYGVKFLYADVDKPLAIVRFFYNGVVFPKGVRMDLDKKVFLDRVADPLIATVLEKSREEILQAISAGLKKV